MKARYLISLIVVSLVVIVSGCVSNISTNSSKSIQNVAYTIGSCAGYKRNAQEYMYTYKNGSLILRFNLDYVCCANLTLHESTSGKNISIYVDNVGEMCKCMCTYPITVSVRVNPGAYNVKILGIKYKDMYNYSLIKELRISTSKPFECATNDDCAWQSSCCHQQAQECVPTFERNTINCTGIACTDVCEECTTCICMDGRCEAKPAGGCC